MARAVEICRSVLAACVDVTCDLSELDMDSYPRPTYHLRVIVVVSVSGYPSAISVVVTVAYETEKAVSVVPNG